jgi:hypothetical protein
MFLETRWLESMRKEIPEYADEVTVISATPENIYEILKDLIDNPEKARNWKAKPRVCCEIAFC